MKFIFPCMCACCPFSHVRLFASLWTVVARRASLSMGFSRQEYWSGVPCPPPGDLPNRGMEPSSPATPVLQTDSLVLSHQGSPWFPLDVYYEGFRQKQGLGACWNGPCWNEQASGLNHHLRGRVVGMKREGSITGFTLRFWDLFWAKTGPGGLCGTWWQLEGCPHALGQGVPRAKLLLSGGFLKAFLLTAMLGNCKVHESSYYW